MTQTITTVAVLGSGVMGSGIAALLANAGCTVHLLDIVPEGATDRDVIAKNAIDKQRKAKPVSGFTHPRNAKRVMPGNLEDNLSVLADCDWIIEAVLEDLGVKQDVYRKVDAHRKKGSVVSSNTSTLPLHVLINGMEEHFTRDFMITHFFNPPRILPLLEITGGETCAPDHLERISAFADVHLGKQVVLCKDTPGFLANRIGIYWMLVGLIEAIDLGISIEDADAVMSKPVGIPKTALFGLYDLIGIDLMPMISKAMLQTLPDDDRFRSIFNEPDIIKTMIERGDTGRKSKKRQGFYALDVSNGTKTKMAMDLSSGEYAKAKKSSLASVHAARGGLSALFDHGDIGGIFAKRVLTQLLHYAASLVPEISDDILNIDTAMRAGFAWKHGPFELIDRLGGDGVNGVDRLIDACEELDLDVPPLLATARGKTFYTLKNNAPHYLGLDGEYYPIPASDDAWMLADITRGTAPITKNGAASLWDMGDGIACLQLTTKMNTIDDEVLAMIGRSVDIVARDFNGLVIGTDADKFSLGANLPFVLYLANLADWNTISSVIKGGQQAMMALKYAPFPVVASLSGMALGGGCEMTLHCDAVQAHMESYPGLVEVGVGLIPGWGGCKEMLVRHHALADRVAADAGAGKKPEAQMAQGAMPVISKSFEHIMLAKVAMSAEEARDMLILNPNSRISMNRQRVLPDAKALCLSLSDGYTPPEPATLHLPGPTAYTALQLAIDDFVAKGQATPHDAHIGAHLAHVLSGGDTDMLVALDEQTLLDLEHDHFMALVKHPDTIARIEHMVSTNKPLRN